jgi:hypothetical protein
MDRYLLKKFGLIHNQIALYRKIPERLDNDGVAVFFRTTSLTSVLQARPSLSVYAHGIGAANAVGAAFAETQAAVLVTLDLHQGIQQPLIGGRFDRKFLIVRRLCPSVD